MNTKKMIGFLAAFLALAGLGSVPAWAESRDSLAVREASASNFVLRASSSDSVGLRLYYVGTATEAVVTITSTTLLTYAPAGTGDLSGIDISAAAYDTYGELCDYLDGLANYGCELLGAKRDDNSNLLRDQTAATGTNDLKASGGFEVKFDTNPGAGGGIVGEVFQMSVGRVAEVGKKLCLKRCEWDANGTGNLTVYGRPDVFGHADGGLTGASTMRALRNVYAVVDVQQTTTDDTEQVEDWTVEGATEGFCFAPGTQVVVRYDDTTNSSIQATANDLRCWFEER